MNNPRTIFASLAALALSCGSANADLTLNFDLDNNGINESSITSSRTDVPFTTLKYYSWTIKNGNKNKGYDVSWAGPSLSAKIIAAPAADKPANIMFTQVSNLVSNERLSDFSMKTPGLSFEKRAKSYVPAVDNTKHEDTYTMFNVLSSNGVGEFITHLVFKSTVKDGTIVYTVENKTDAKVTVTWPGTGISGDIDAGKTLTENRKAANGATERKSVATFNPKGGSLGDGVIGFSVSYLAPAGGVPTPGTLALAGLAGLAASRRRR
ncbi:MAG: hypothetical protein KF912_00695 [Phycisphaeraceae bacterium]|nr:hypothetical protein [Phycisphaeraceae bacterium]QYK48303.1 MAG: hypothetical protein KF838_00275 [Phycisphaeraceae bacterium]